MTADRKKLTMLQNCHKSLTQTNFSVQPKQWKTDVRFIT
jgi:hypothetical protein